jgi:GT2 family glycosyltransferase
MVADEAVRLSQVHWAHETTDQREQSQRSRPLTPNGFAALWTKEFEPAVMLEVEISQPLPDTPGLTTESGKRYHRALALVRLHSQPIGLLELPLWEAGITPHQLALNIWEALGSQINAHLVADGLVPIHDLSPEGLQPEETPPCLEGRRAFLANAPFVSVVIPTHERPQQVVKLVHSILASEYPADRFEVIVVDNAPSGPDTAQLIWQIFGEHSQVRYTRKNRAGSSYARNTGIELAVGDIVVFADDDVLVDRYWLAEMARGFETSNEVGCVTGLIIPMELKTPAQQWFEQFGGFCKAGMARRLFSLTDHRDANPLFPYNVGSYGAGASMAFRRSVLRELKGFDLALGPATLTLGGEDIDAMLRMILSGRTLLYAPAAIVHHCARREYRQLHRQIQGYGSGLAACLFKTAISRPRQTLDFLRKLPRGLLFAFNPWSPHHAGKIGGYPMSLTLLEVWGFLCGSAAYLLSCRRITQNAMLYGAATYPELTAVSVSELR